MINEDIKALLKSPIYQMTCSSMENSHSDFWCWMFKNIGIECLSLFNVDFKNGDKIKNVWREYMHFDLYIETELGKIVIIENKMKSAFRKEQIIKYSKKIYDKFKNNNVALRIITYFQDLSQKDTEITTDDEGFFEEIFQWEPLSYSDLCNKLQDFHCDNLFVDEYRKVLMNLSNIKVKLMNQESITYENGSMLGVEGLQDIRLDDIYKKYKASDFKNYLEKNLKTPGVACNFYYQSGRGATTVSFNKDNINFLITVQGDNYRREANDDNENNIILKKWLDLSKECNNNWEKQSEYSASHMRDKSKCNSFYGSSFYRPFNIYDYFKEVSYDTLLLKIKSDLSMIL